MLHNAEMVCLWFEKEQFSLGCLLHTERDNIEKVKPFALCSFFGWAWHITSMFPIKYSMKQIFTGQFYITHSD